MNGDPAFVAAMAVSKALFWLFADPVGRICLGGALLVLLFVRYAKALKERSLLLQGAGKKMGFGKAVSALAEETVSIGALAAANVPALIAMVAVLSVAVTLSGTMVKLDEFLGLQRKLKEYGLVLKNLERRYKVARVECLGTEGDRSKLLIRYFDQDGKAVPESDERLEMRGSDIYIDALVVNFAYSGIESGEKVNLALPYRIFSEKVAQKDGHRLRISASGLRPSIYERSDTQVYGLEKETFDRRLDELLVLFQDAEKARKAGLVRSVYGNAVHRVLRKGDAFLIWIEQSGGLTIKEEKVF